MPLPIAESQVLTFCHLSSRSSTSSQLTQTLSQGKGLSNASPKLHPSQTSPPSVSILLPTSPQCVYSFTDFTPCSSTPLLKFLRGGGRATPRPPHYGSPKPHPRHRTASQASPTANVKLRPWAIWSLRASPPTQLGTLNPTPRRPNSTPSLEVSPSPAGCQTPDPARNPRQIGRAHV